MKTQFSIVRPLVLILATMLIGFGMQQMTAIAQFLPEVSKGAASYLVLESDIPPIYWTENDFSSSPHKEKIQRLNGTNLQDIVSGFAPGTYVTLLAVDARRGKIYYKTQENREKAFYRANLDGSNIQHISPENIQSVAFYGDRIYWTNYGGSQIHTVDQNISDWQPIDAGPHVGVIAIDAQNGKIYWDVADTENPSHLDYRDFKRKIQRANLDGSNIQDIVTGLDSPDTIAVDVQGGKIYWADWITNKIQRANLDGSNIQDIYILAEDNQTSISLDVQGGKIYWTDSLNIKRANLDGSNVRTIIKAQSPDAHFATQDVHVIPTLTTFPHQPEPPPPPTPAVPVEPAPLPEPLTPEEIAAIERQAKVAALKEKEDVVSTGTWFAVQQPSGLSAANFVIKPGTFAIFVHKNPPSVSQPTDFNTYRLRSVLGAADFPNLADFFQNGGQIELVSHPSLNPLPPNTREPEFGDVVISEIMWGLNGSNQGKQYIELYNTSAHAYTFANGDLMFRFSKASEEPLPAGIFAPPFNTNARVKVIDKVSNKDWKVPGQSGNISRDQPLISMYRTINYTTGSVPDGTLANNWRASNRRVNLLPPSYGTPGAKHLPPAPVVHVGLSERPPMYWVNTDDGTLHRLIGDEVENLASSVQNATDLAIDMTGGKLYWTERTGDRTGRIRRANLDGTNVKLVKNLTSAPYSIALDTVNGKLYLTNAWGKIQRMNLDGSNFQPNLITGLESPRHLVLDVTGGKVYWTETTEASGRIRRANLNGSSVQNVATGLAEPLSLAVATGKVYWTSVGKLQRANLDGTNSEVLETLPLAPTSMAVDPARNLLYLTTPSGDIHRKTLDGSGEQPIVTGLVSPSNIVLGITATTPGPTDAPEPPATPVVDAAPDVNQDKKVNKTDLLLVVTALGESPPANPNFDVNADGSVNIADMLLVIEALDDPVAAAAPSFGETVTSLDPAFLTMQIDILRAESDGSMKYEHAIAFFQSLLASIRPTETRLLANYPNPFNPETWIPYQLATDSTVRITIYDARGSVVRVLTLGHQSTGYYTSRSRAAYWDGRNALGERVASGFYFYQLQADDRSQMRKLLILK